MNKDYLDFISTLVLGGVGIAITIIYNRHSKKIAQDQIFKELFTDFNKRYDKLNNGLIEIQQKCPSIETFKETEENEQMKYKKCIIDYFILCSEEFFWHQKKRIDDKVWNSWQIGMHQWFNEVETISEVWFHEINKPNGKASYYITDEEEFFPKLAKRQ